MTTYAHIAYADVVTLTSWMAHQGYTADEVAEAVRKPFDYQPELSRAKAFNTALSGAIKNTVDGAA